MWRENILHLIVTSLFNQTEYLLLLMSSTLQLYCQTQALAKVGGKEVHFEDIFIHRFANYS